MAIGSIVAGVFIASIAAWLIWLRFGAGRDIAAGALADAIVLGFSVWLAAIGIGLWKLRNWGRWLAMGLSGLFVATIGFVVVYAVAGEQVQLAALVGFVPPIVAFGFPLWYMSRPVVKKAFVASSAKA